jgi:trehalose/maltose hydrolase-like predicted phosphorylase
VSRWLLTYDTCDPADEGLREALCTLGNGFFATRGAAPESVADSVHYPGTYLAGCYDRLTSQVGSREVENEDLVNAPNWLPLTFRIEGGDWLSPEHGTLLEHRRELNLKRGVLTRRLRIRDSAGRTTLVTQRRLVSMDDPHLAALETTIVPEDWTGRLEVRSGLDGRVANTGVSRYRALSGDHLVPDGEGSDGEIMWLRVQTATSRVGIAVAARTRVTTGDAERGERCEPGRTFQNLIMDAAQGTPVTVEKVAALYTSRDRAIFECAAAARQQAARAASFDRLLERQVLAWDRLWRRCQISIEHDDAQRVLNLHMFHLLQTVSEHSTDLDVGVPARGLHGEAYRGHVFWDELFILPFLGLRFPEIARSLLMYRWRRLPQARWAAREAGLPGAMYPWQSGSDGREESQQVHLNPRSGRWKADRSPLQRHVGLAVACNVWRFYEATGDIEFLAEYGAEILLEVARFFAALATYDRATDRYEIRGVMGPDEYHDGYPGRDEPGVDNNAYTNVMTVWVLRRALDVVTLLPQDRRAELCERLGLTREEITRFEDVSRRMRVVFHDGIISQFEGYDRLAELDWAAYREKYRDIRRLDRILEAEGDSTNRYRVSKQADVLMLLYLLSPDDLTDLLTRLGYDHDPGLIPRTVAYYMARTSNGSTLSALVHAWLLARTDGDTAWSLFLDTLHSDIDDIQRGTTAEGIHLGAMAGSVDLVQRCFAGLQPRGEVLHLDPRLPPGLPGLRFTLRYRGHWGIEVTCDPEHLRVGLRPGVASPIRVNVGGRTARIDPGGVLEFPLDAGRPLPLNRAPA